MKKQKISMIKDEKNLFRLKKEIDANTIKDIKNEAIEDRIIRNEILETFWSKKKIITNK